MLCITLFRIRCCFLRDALADMILWSAGMGNAIGFIECLFWSGLDSC